MFSLSAQEAILEVFTEDAYPLQYEKEGKIVGSATTLVEKVLKEANVKYKIVMQPWARIYNTALVKPNVLIYSLARTKEREGLFSWLGPIQQVNYALYGFSNIKLTATDSFEILNNFRLAVGRDTAVHHYLANKQLDKLHLIDNFSQSIKMLLTNRIDLATGSDLFFSITCQKENLNCSQIKPVYPLKELEVSLYLAASKTTDIEIIKRIQVAFENVTSQPTSEQ